MGQKTPLFDEHVALGARMVDFAGWEMPLHYGSQVDEHHCVRKAAGLFDVSHMAIVDLEGEGAKALLQRLVANDVAKLTGDGQALYGCLLNERGGVIDDLIVYRLHPGAYRVVVNAATRARDLDWITANAQTTGASVQERADLAMIAVQGPQARGIVHGVLGADFAPKAEALPAFSAAELGGVFVARTGYTGEDGYEILLPGERAAEFWRALRSGGAVPAGLGARDTLRLEAGMNLYGQDMDEEVTPLESGLAWTVSWDPPQRAFIGREALEAQRRDGVRRKRVGLLLADKGVLRSGQEIECGGRPVGRVTSGGYSPTLARSIALARVESEVSGHCQVRSRGRLLEARLVKPPFVRQGVPCIEL